MSGPGTAVRAHQVPRVLSIAGTDPTGGAGIQADLKAIAANGGYGMAVVTALVAQNTRGVRDIHTPPPEFLAAQLDAVSDDVEIDAVKIGMLFDAEHIAVVARWLAVTRPPCVVLDPVMVATSGDRLLDPSAQDALRDLVRHVDLVTPNLPELAVLVGEPVASTWAGAVRQATGLSERHDLAVLVKGGHLDSSDSPDALVHAARGVLVEVTAPRLPTRNVHGTGCSLSAAVATLRPQADGWEPAVRRAKAWLTESIAAADDLHVGRGNGPVSHFAGLWRRGQAVPPTPDDVARQWWRDVAEVRAGIDDLAFIRGLVDGTLAEEAFTWYIAQDALYLRDYSRVLAAASALAPTPAEQLFWSRGANTAIATELGLHAGFLPPGAVFDAHPGPATTGYLNHLLATAARGSYDELVAALLPCYWIYADLGSRLVRHATPGHPYAAWLRTYGDDGFAESNRQAIGIVTARAARVDAETRERMRAAFITSARHELAFFAAPLEDADAGERTVVALAGR